MAQNWGSWTRWTPTITGSTTDPSLGTGAVAVGGYIQMGTIVNWWMQITFGTSPNVGDGFYQFPMPVRPIELDVPIGTGFCLDLSDTYKVYPLTALIATGQADYLTTERSDPFVYNVADAASGAEITVGSAVPFTWAAGDKIHMSGSYEATTS